MAGKNQQVPRAVPSTLLEVHFVQRAGKLYKVLLPTLLKNKNSTTQLPTTPIVFEARNLKTSKTVRKSKEPPPFLKPVTLTPTEYKAIPLFKRGERIVDADWLPEERDCITNLLKNHKAFQDGNTDPIESMLPKIVSVTSNDITVPTEASVISQKDASSMYEKSSSKVSSQALDDIGEMTKEKIHSDPTFINDNENVIGVSNHEAATPVSEVKLEDALSSNIKSPSSPNGESCIVADVKSPMKSVLENKSTKSSKVCTDNSTNSLGTSSEINLLPNGGSSVEDVNNVIPEESMVNSSDEEKTLLEKLKNARTVKVQTHRNNSTLKEQTNSVLQADFSIKECKHEMEKSATLKVTENGKSHNESSVSSSQNDVSLQQAVENNANTCNLTAAVALVDHDYAASYAYFVNPYRKRTVGHYELRVIQKPKYHPHAYNNLEKTTKSTSAKARGRKPSVTLQDVTQNQICIDKSDVLCATDSILTMQCQKFLSRKLPQPVPATSVAGKQNSPGVVKNIIKLLMPRSFSNTCSEKDTVQALNRIEKLNAVANGVVKTSTTPTNTKTLELKYNTVYGKPAVSPNATVVLNTADGFVNREFKDSSPTEGDLSATDVEFSLLEPEVIIYESKDTFVIEDGKLKLCPSKKRIRKKRNSKRSVKHRRKHNVSNANHVYSKSPNEEKPVTEDVQKIEALSEEKECSDNMSNKETANLSLKRTADNMDSFQNTKYQRETLLPPAPKVRKLFICRSEKTTSSLLQSCFIWLDKMDEKYLDDGRLDTAEVPEDILFGVRDTSHPYSKSQRNHKHYISKTAYLKNDPIVIVESPASASKDIKSEESEQIDNFAAKIVEERKEANNRMADVLRLLEEKRKAIEALRQKNLSHAIMPIVP